MGGQKKGERKKKVGCSFGHGRKPNKKEKKSKGALGRRGGKYFEEAKRWDQQLKRKELFLVFRGAIKRTKGCFRFCKKREKGSTSVGVRVYLFFCLISFSFRKVDRERVRELAFLF